MAAPAGASPTLVQHASKDTGTTLSASLAFPLNNTAGNWIGVVIRAGHSGQVFTVSDTRGNSYQQAVLFNQTLDTPNGDTLGMFYAENIAGGANTVTVSESISSNTLRFAILEYSGLATTNSLDVTATSTAQGAGSQASSGSGATTSAGDLVIGAVINGSGVTCTAGAGYVLEERVPAAPNTKLIVEDRVQAAAGSVAVSASFSASASWGAAVAAFKAAGGAGGAPPSITGLSPTSGPAGASVTIMGTGFGPAQGTSTVMIGSTVATVTSWSNTSVVAIVPSNLSAFTNVGVDIVVSGVASNSVIFGISPNITSLIPIAGLVGTPVTITGTNFGLSQGTSTVTFNGVVATPTGWSPTSIVVPVPAGAATGNVAVLVGGLASNGAPFGVPPTITGLSPGSGAPGTLVTISGTGFGVSQGTSTFTLNGTTATPTNWSATSITAPVPTGATSGPLYVTVGGLASNGVGFSVASPAPLITSLTPNSSPVGASVTIAGANFGAFQGSGGVMFNGTTAAPLSWNATSIIVLVPTGATTGNVVVNVGSVASNGISFTVTPPPNITSLTPNNGPVGTSVTISGTNFGALRGTGSYVTFNGIAVVPSNWSDTSIVAQVPAGATTGNVVVYVSGVPSSGISFTVTPVTITSVSPTAGPVGASVSIFGTNFGPTQSSSTVALNGAIVSTGAWSSTVIDFTVPTGATTGNVVVAVGGQASNGIAFNVNPISVSVTPATYSLPATTATLFGATVQNDLQNKGVTWSISGAGCSGAACGTLYTASGQNTGYIAPSVVPSPRTVTVTATSVADPTKSGSAMITVLPPPANITSVNPTVGPVGTQVTINGSNFGASQGTSVVQFNFVNGAPTNWSDTSMTVPVPTNATSGNLVVFVNSFPSNSVSFTVPPAITTLSPNSGVAGTSISITGTGFGTTQGTSTVTFNGTTATPTSWSATSIIVPVPTAATTGNVVVTIGGQASGGVNFTVLAAAVPIALVQHVSKDAGATNSSTLAFGANNTAGNFIAVAIRAGHSGQVFTVKDSRGNAYHQAVQFNVTVDTPNGDTLGIFYAENIAGGANALTVSDTIAASTLRFAILEYSGVATSSSLDVFTAAQGVGTSANSGNATTTANGDLLFAAILSSGGANFTSGTGYTLRDTVPALPSAKIVTEDQVQAVAGTAAGSASLNVSAKWGAGLAAFKAAQAGGSTSPAITSLNPASGPVGTSVTIAGTNFGAAQGTSTVTFNGVTATPTSWSATNITALVPASLPTGGANVIVTVNGVASNGATFTVTLPPPISVTLTPVRGGATITQPMALTAAVQNDSSNAGVSWTSSGGTLSNTTSTSATFSATAAGVYTITATSKADITRSASAVIGVTDFAAVSTWRNDNSRSGVNSQEYALTPQNVTTKTFGKLFSCSADGQVFAQPLWVANVSIANTLHNVVFVATENDTLYAFDADGPGCKPVWSTLGVSLIPSGEVIVPFADLENDNALGPVVGITGTPVIDPVSQTIYLVALSKDSAKNVIQRLHAVDITTGLERPGSPQIVSASITGASGYDNSGGTIVFAPKFQKQRPALLLLNGVIYISWAGFLDTDFYHGWLISYDAKTLSQVSVFNDTPDGGRGGIWMSGGGPAADSLGNIYLLTGNGDFNGNITGGRNFGDTFLKLGTSGGISVADWFTPHDQNNMATNDLDLGGGGAVILLDQTAGPLQHLVLGGSKGGMLYVVNRDGFGGYNSSNDSQIVQSFVLGSNGIYSAPLFWQNTLYAAGSGSSLGAYPFSPTTEQFQTSPSFVSSQIFSHPGTTPSLSATGTSNAILWAIRRPSATAPAVLHAFDPNNIHTALWDSSQATGGRDQAGVTVKFTVPTVANGKVYIGTQTELDVYGLLPN